MSVESHIYEKKSLRKFIGPQADLKGLAKTCVGLANAQGGKLIIGIEDKQDLPPAPQRIDMVAVNLQLRKLASLTVSVGITDPELVEAVNGGQYFQCRIHPSVSTIATTSEGSVYMRLGEECLPIRSEDLTRLAAERSAFQWELQPTKILISQADSAEVKYFLNEVRQSPKVTSFLKLKADEELLEHYQLVYEGLLTNLGVVWIGTPAQRARIRYAPTVTYLVYDDLEQKVRKETWADFRFNPKRLLEDIRSRAEELHYTSEVPGGLLRTPVRHYPEPVIRELLANALAHRIYTTPNEVEIRVYPDRLEINSPGGLPHGVTPKNILHQRVRRNLHLMNTFEATQLMEGEGSGYDKIYEELSRSGKPLPEIEDAYDKLQVTVRSREIDAQTLLLITHLAKHHIFRQKEVITLGLIARNQHLSAPDLAQLLQLREEERLRQWLGRLCDWDIVLMRGQGKGTRYYVNPEAYAAARLNIKPSLKTLEPHRLRALIEVDLRTYPDSSISQIHARLGEVSRSDIQKEVYSMVADEELSPSGPKSARKYKVAEKKRNEKGM
jgi:ATP-dependent DNA helicase RecG